MWGAYNNPETMSCLPPALQVKAGQHLPSSAAVSAGTTVVVEEFLTGEEASFFAFIDGENCIPLVGAQVGVKAGEHC